MTTQEVVEARLGEIDRCLKADAPLAVTFLVGSTLEGLLSELALAHASTYVAHPEARRLRDRQVKPVDRWTLAELIAVSRALGVVGESVAQHANQVRSFRNCIHPRQQLRERFEPPMDTAQIAHHVLAAAADLRRISEHGAPWD